MTVGLRLESVLRHRLRRMIKFRSGRFHRGFTRSGLDHAQLNGMGGRVPRMVSTGSHLVHGESTTTSKSPEGMVVPGNLHDQRRGPSVRPCCISRWIRALPIRAGAHRGRPTSSTLRTRGRPGSALLPPRHCSPSSRGVRTSLRRPGRPSISLRCRCARRPNQA